jgi:Tfp pilus assembly protein PilO
MALTQIVVAFLLIILSSALAYAGSLQEEFDQLCVHTQEAESLSLEKLQELLTECDQLQKKIEDSNDEKKKLLLFRLNKCRNFFVYVIDLKQGSGTKTSQ